MPRRVYVEIPLHEQACTCWKGTEFMGFKCGVCLKWERLWMRMEALKQWAIRKQVDKSAAGS